MMQYLLEISANSFLFIARKIKYQVSSNTNDSCHCKRCHRDFLHRQTFEKYGNVFEKEH